MLRFVECHFFNENWQLLTSVFIYQYKYFPIIDTVLLLNCRNLVANGLLNVLLYLTLIKLFLIYNFDSSLRHDLFFKQLDLVLDGRIKGAIIALEVDVRADNEHAEAQGVDYEDEGV